MLGNITSVLDENVAADSCMRNDVCGFMSISLDDPDWQWMERVMLMCGDV